MITTKRHSHLLRIPGVRVQPYAGISRHGDVAEVWLPGMKLKNPLNGGQRFHMGKPAERKRVRMKVSDRLRLEYGASRFTLPVKVTVTRVYSGHGKPMDKHDGLGASLKPVIDGVADWLIVDDAKLDCTVHQERGPVPGVRVRVERGSE